jgi:outer membrane protein assembly factor BamA
MRMTRLFGKHGYVDTAIEPQFSIDSDVQRIDIVFRLDPGIQYRIGSVQVRGWSAAAERLVRSKFEFGQVFDTTALREIFEENKKLLPSGVTAENSVAITRDPSTGTVGIVFENRRCQTS